jgi:hypothetical protein
MKKIFFNKRNFIIFAIAVSITIVALVFQNCGKSSSSQNPQGTVATTAATGTSCVLPATVLWSVGPNTCSASGGTTVPDASSITVVGAAPSVGSATFSCASGSLSGAFGTSCTSGCTGAACLANGVCGSDNGLGLSTIPTGAINLCSAGTASAVTGTGPWAWTCVGNNGGISATCSAVVGTITPIGSTSGSLVAPCTVPAYNYPLGSGFLMNTQNGYGNVCCVPSPSENGVANGLGWYCVDSPTWEVATTSGPATPLPAGTACSVTLVAGYPTGAGVISYTHAGTELCCSIAHPFSGNGDGKGWYCEPSNATTAAVSAGSTQAGTACSVQGITTYGNNTGITLYTSANQRVCCEIGAAYGGPGDGKGWYCEAY